MNKSENYFDNVISGVICLFFRMYATARSGTDTNPRIIKLAIIELVSINPLGVGESFRLYCIWQLRIVQFPNINIWTALPEGGGWWRFLRKGSRCSVLSLNMSRFPCVMSNQKYSSYSKLYHERKIYILQHFVIQRDNSLHLFYSPSDAASTVKKKKTNGNVLRIERTRLSHFWHFVTWRVCVWKNSWWTVQP